MREFNDIDKWLQTNNTIGASRRDICVQNIERRFSVNAVHSLQLLFELFASVGCFFNCFIKIHLCSSLGNPHQQKISNKIVQSRSKCNSLNLKSTSYMLSWSNATTTVIGQTTTLIWIQYAQNLAHSDHTNGQSTFSYALPLWYMPKERYRMCSLLAIWITGTVNESQIIFM